MPGAVVYVGNTKRKGSDLIITMTIVDLLSEIYKQTKNTGWGRVCSHY